MVGPVQQVISWLGQRWPACLAVFACAVLLLLPRARPAAVEIPTAPAPAPPALAISVHVKQADAEACSGADAGACGHSLTSGAAGAPREVALPGARVRLFERDGARHVLRAEVLTDGAGQARLPAASGAYWLLVDAPGRARRSEPLGFDGAGPPIELSLGRADPLEVTVLDSAGQPLAGATVQVRTDDALPFGALTSASGVARFEHVGRRIESVRATAPGHDSALANPTSRQVTLTLSAPAALEIAVRDPSGAPAPGAEVWVSGIDFWPPRQVSAGPDGTALLTGLGRGTYDLRAKLGSWVSSGALGITLERGQREKVTLALGEGRFVTALVAAGEGEGAPPVAGADVTLVEDGLSPFPLSARTGADGRCVLGPLPRSNAVLNVRADGFMPESVPVPRQSDAEMRVALVRGGRVSGRVVDGEGNAIEGARLEVLGNDLRGRPIARQSGAAVAPSSFFESSLAPPLPVVPMGELGVLAGPLPVPGMPPVAPAPSSSWVSDLDGNYQLDDVPPGRMRLLARHPDFVEAVSEGVTLEPGGSVSVRLVLKRGARLTGRLLDELGRPVARARVDALSHQTTQESVLTGSDGYFTFRAVPARVDLLVARPEQRQRFVLRESLSLAPGESRELELTLPAERAPLTVTVRDDDGRALSDASLSLLSLDPRYPLRLGSESDALGESQLPDAVGMRATLRVGAAGFRMFEAELDPVPARVEVTLSRGVSVAGRVTRDGGRQGVRGAEVVLLQDGERRSATSDENGDYELSLVALGPGTLSVRHPQFSTETWDVGIAASGREGRAIDLEPIDLFEPGTASGTVVDARGAPVRGARVGVGLVPAFVPAEARLPGFVETDASGRFELRGLAPGQVVVSAYASGVGRGSVSGVRVVAGEPVRDLLIRLISTHVEREPSALANVAVTLGERTVGSELEVVIVNVAAGSEAERAGVRQGDVLWSIDDEVVADMADARQMLGGSDGSDVILELEREGETAFVRVRREAVR